MVNLVLNSAIEGNAISVLARVAGNCPDVIEISGMGVGACGFKSKIPVYVPILQIEAIR